MQVPVEEYSFFVVQTALTALWLLGMLERALLEAAIALLVGGKGARGFPDHSMPRTGREPAIRAWGVALLLGAAGMGVGLLLWGAEETLYLALILAWALPVLAL